MFKSFTIRNLPPFTDWKGRAYPQRWGVSLRCSRGHLWDGGEYASRDEALAVGAARTA